MNRESKSLVNASAHSVHDLFQPPSFALGYFQREYVWEEPQVEKLMADLSGKFLKQWRAEHSPGDVSGYDPYFLGPFIVYQENGRTFLADGQQRIITLLLLLIFLRRRTGSGLLSTLILSEQFGRRTFRVDVNDYADCFDALLHGREFDADGAPPNIRRVWEAYRHIGAHFPDDLHGDVLGLFVDWLLHRVSLVAMDAGDPDRAVEMFQSINDRGVHLSPMDHLKRYLLSDAECDPRMLEGSWGAMVANLERVERGAAFAYVRTVLRSRFPGSAAGINGATHEWMHAHAAQIWPDRKNGDRSRLFTEVLYPLHGLYVTLLRARNRLHPSLRAVRFTAVNGIADQFDLTFAAVRPGDPKSVQENKAALVAGFLDLFLVAQALDDEPADQGTVDELVAEVLPAVRQAASEDDLRRVLGAHAAAWPARLKRIPDLAYTGKKKLVRYVLARLTAWVETGGGREDPTERFLTRRPGDLGFEIEHLFPSTPPAGVDPRYYGHLRHQIGGLLLLDGKENRTYGGVPLAQKLNQYRSDTLLAGLLNPDFLAGGNAHLRLFLTAQGLIGLVPTYTADTPMQPFLEARNQFYLEIAKRVWSLQALGLLPPSGIIPAPRPGMHTVRVKHLVRNGLIGANAQLVGRHQNQTIQAQVLADGHIQTTTGRVFASPTPAVTDLVGVAKNGWTFWSVQQTGEKLGAVRKRYLDGLR
ncbi:DUF262 domain-containing protein [Actinoplanes sp. NBRC 101535]|uniref:GmrSD restriction endonuclease domain-containing protein n=1 Tax=Actinoplanes sp. NBRC 101535 TaxID=3032196 RepID=UPI0024A1003C|nr:DUF262 domain-containing protein [Actinoplanes sp. NBRC 101535]GLY02815.1 hypothetical protein Acsp01_31940 [Actinoplanes sp. NBRC 101535]